MNGFAGMYPSYAAQYAYGGAPVGAGLPPAPVQPPGTFYGEVGGAVPAVGAPRRQLVTMVVARDAMGGVSLVDTFPGRPYLTRRDFSSFNKVLRLQKRLNRLVPRRSRRRKRGK